MNTYNENLRSAVVTSLQNQDLEQKNLDSKLTASMFTLYHAEGATITAYEKLTNAKKDLKFKTQVKALAVSNSNIANNELASATQASALMKQSVSNTAVCAANVQIAATAVVKLASDMGSIFSIINAADYGSDIYVQAEDAYDKINQTAYDAEYASQLAMEASVMASEVSSSTVLELSKSTNNLMNSVLKVASDEYNAASGIVTGDNAALEAANTNEKIAEGNYEYLGVDYNAIKNAYDSLNDKLNLGLKVTVSDSNSTEFTVQFHNLDKPFADVPPTVASYYIFIAEESQSSLFSLSSAESLNKTSNSFIEVSPPGKNADSLKLLNNIGGVTISQKNNIVSVDINNIDSNGLVDTNGKPLSTGTSYVAFVMAVFTDEYKRKVNNFSDYLSAPSLAFTMTYTLQAAQNITCTTLDSSKPDNDKANKLAFAQQQNNVHFTADTNYNYKLEFSTPVNSNYPVEYRCMLLPATKSLIASHMLTTESYEELLGEIEALEKIASKFDPKITDLQSELYQLEMQSQQSDSDKLTPKLQGELKQKTEKLSQNLTNLITQKENLIRNLKADKKTKMPFFFNVDLAEQVPAGCYFTAVKDTTPQPSRAEKLSNWVAYIKPGTTDNFGNMLVDGQEYIPIILSASMATDENLSKFTNALSEPGTKFTYNDTTNILKN